MKAEPKLLAQELYIYSFGLFPFFVKSSIQVKPDLINIFRTYIISLGIEMIPMLSGLISSLLPGLEEQDESLKREIQEMLIEINMRVGNRFFLNTLWMILLRNSNNRVSCLKVLSKKFQQLSDGLDGQSTQMGQQLAEGNQKTIPLMRNLIREDGSPNSYMANIQMIVNGLCQSIEDQDIVVKKMTLDFMIKFIKVEEDSYFSESQQEQLIFSLFQIITCNDLSLIKRLVKFLFNKNDFSELQLDQLSENLKEQCCKVFNMFISLDNKQGEEMMPVMMIQHLHKLSPDLAQYILSKNSFDYFYYCFHKGFQRISNSNSQILVETKNFMKNHPQTIQHSITQFEIQILQMDQFRDIDFLTFILKFIILDSHLQKESQSQFLSSVILVISKILRVEVSQFEEHREDQMKKMAIYFDFSISCLHQMKDLNFVQIQEDSEIYSRYYQSLQNFTLALEELLSLSEVKLSVFPYLKQFFQILVYLDWITSRKPLESTDELPQWTKLLLKSLHFTTENLVYEALEILHSFFSFQKELGNINNYIRLFYEDKQFSQGGIGEKIVEKLFALIDIKDYKQLFLNFYMKLTKINFKYMSNYIIGLLQSENKILENFKKVSRLWSITHKFVNTECNYVLNNSIKHILKLRLQKNQLMNNQLKNWLTYSPKAFQIILDNLCKSVILQTNWMLQDRRLVYNHAFDCQESIQNIDQFKFIIDISGQYFITFLQQEKINPDFMYYLDELEQCLFNVFQGFPENKNYLAFFLQIYLRYYTGEYNDMMTRNSDHDNKINEIKEEIVSLFQLILKMIKDQELVAHLSYKLFPYAVKNLLISYRGYNHNSTIIYLNFVKYMCFQTQLASLPQTKEYFFKFITDTDFIPIIIKGLQVGNLFVIQEINEFLVTFNLLISETITHPALTFVINKVLMGYINCFVEWENKRSLSQSVKDKEHFRDIELMLLNGVKSIYSYYLGESDKQQVHQKNLLLTMFTMGFAQGEVSTVINFKRDSKTCNKILEDFPALFNTLLLHWNKLYSLNQAQLNTLEVSRNQGLNEKIISGIERGIGEILMPLKITFQKNIVEFIAQSWMNSNILLNDQNLNKTQTHHYNLKILELISFLEIPPVEFLEDFNNSTVFKKTLNLKRYKKSKPKKQYTLEWIDCKFETDLLSLLFNYLKFTEIKETDSLFVFQKMYEILKVFEESMIPSSLLWILDILDLMIGTMRVEAKEFESTKYKYQMLLGKVIGSLVRIQGREIQIEYVCKKDEVFEVVFPLNPTVGNLLTQQDSLPAHHCEGCFNFTKTGVENERRYLLFNYWTFDRTFLNLINTFFSDFGQVLYSPFKIRVFFEKIWKNFNNRTMENTYFIQLTSQLILKLIKENKMFTVEYKNEIFDVFQSDLFFNSNKKTLRLWSQIMEFYLSEINPDILNNYLEKINFSSMFSTKNTENKLRIKSFQRICFIIFSGKKERFIDKEKLKVFLVKIKEVLKDQKVHPYLIILVFFTLRILILRLKQETLNDLLKSMWSSILFLIDEMICSKKDYKQEEIFIAALKLLEMISYADIDEFNLHRWAFLFDYFGVEFKKNIPNQAQVECPFIFKPVLTHKLSPNTLIDYDVVSVNKEQQEDKVKFVLVENNLTKDQKLEDVAMLFLTSWIKFASVDKELDYDQMEDMIYGDFIDFRRLINL